jgi:hypothetical protein
LGGEKGRYPVKESTSIVSEAQTRAISVCMRSATKIGLDHAFSSGTESHTMQLGDLRRTMESRLNAGEAPSLAAAGSSNNVSECKVAFLKVAD